MKAAHQWWDREQSPKPPWHKPSWACSQAWVDMLKVVQYVKHSLASESNCPKASEVNLGGIALAM